MKHLRRVLAYARIPVVAARALWRSVKDEWDRSNMTAVPYRRVAESNREMMRQMEEDGTLEWLERNRTGRSSADAIKRAREIVREEPMTDDGWSKNGEERRKFESYGCTHELGDIDDIGKAIDRRDAENEALRAELGNLRVLLLASEELGNAARDERDRLRATVRLANEQAALDTKVLDRYREGAARQQETIDDLTQQLDAMSRKAIDAKRLLDEARGKSAATGRMEVREACRQRYPLDGSDAQALEHALTITERERDAALEALETLEHAAYSMITCDNAAACVDEVDSACEDARELLRKWKQLPARAALAGDGETGGGE